MMSNIFHLALALERAARSTLTELGVSPHESRAFLPHFTSLSVCRHCPAVVCATLCAVPTGRSRTRALPVRLEPPNVKVLVKLPTALTSGFAMSCCIKWTRTQRNVILSLGNHRLEPLTAFWAVFRRFKVIS